MSLVTDATGNHLTYQIIGTAMKVRNELGHGFKEEVYEKALELRLNLDRICVERQYRIHVGYEGMQVAIFYLDLFAENQVVIEIKAFSHQLTNDELAQVLNLEK
jgi:GxxExxY protein